MHALKEQAAAGAPGPWMPPGQAAGWNPQPVSGEAKPWPLHWSFLPHCCCCCYMIVDQLHFLVIMLAVSYTHTRYLSECF